ncbi:MAG: PAS domain S-box protein [Desulfobacterales bacterium]|nr:PAS domain S-box protein [Desulfobacterales bacterium]
MFKSGNFYRPIFIGFTLIILLFILAGFVSYFEISSLGNLTSTIYKHPLEVSNASLKANMGVVSIHRSMKDIVLADNNVSIEKFISKVNIEQKFVIKNLNTVKEKILGEKGKKLEQETRDLFMKWKPIRDDVIALVKVGERKKAAEITTEKGAYHVSLLEKKIHSLNLYARNKAEYIFNQALDVKERVTTTTLVITITGVILSLIITYMVIKQMTTSLKMASESNREYIKEQEFTQEALDSQLDTFFVFDSVTGKTKRWNKMFENISGYSYDEVMDSHTLKTFFSENDQEKASKAIGVTLKERSSTVELTLICKNGDKVPLEYVSSLVETEGGQTFIMSVGRDITERKRIEKEREQIIKDLEHALEQIKTLKGIIPICSYCKQIRNDEGFWQQVELYIHENADVKFTHGVCPECEAKVYSEMDL